MIQVFLRPFFCVYNFTQRFSARVRADQEMHTMNTKLEEQRAAARNRYGG